MPTPKEGMTHDEWMSMCMGSKEMMKTFPDQKQRTAVCISKWENKDKKKDKAELSIFSEEFLKKFLEKHPEYAEYFAEEKNDGQD